MVCHSSGTKTIVFLVGAIVSRWTQWFGYTYNVLLVSAVFGALDVRTVHWTVTHGDDPGPFGTILWLIRFLP